MNTLDETLAARQQTHGDYEAQATVWAALTGLLTEASRARRLNPAQRYAVHMILAKLSRIVCGNPDEPDHWRDIAGYARLVERGLTARKEPTT